MCRCCCLLTSCSYSNLISLLTPIIDLLSLLSGERSNLACLKGHYQCPLQIKCSNLIQPLFAGRNLFALSDHLHPPPRPLHHYHSCVKWLTGQENRAVLMCHVWIIHVASRRHLQNLLAHQVALGRKVNNKCLQDSLMQPVKFNMQ